MVALFVGHARSEARFTKTISAVHFVTGALKRYVEEEGQFPESLEALADEGDTDSNPLDHFLPGVEVSYRKPAEDAEAGFVVLEVRYEGKTIEVTKEFERREIR